MRCACDACEIVFGAHDARTPDGYCGFCSGSCFPVGSVDGRPIRTSMTLESRRHLHGAARVARAATENLPADPRAVADAARQEAAEAFVRFAAPWVEKASEVVSKTVTNAGRSALDAVRRKLKA